MGMRERIEELGRRRARIAAMGGAAAVARQHAAGKLTVRERIDLLFDGGTFVEVGAHATHAELAPSMAGRETPADGVVTGFGQVDGRPVCVIAYDFTVMAGSMGRTGEHKCARIREMALRDVRTRLRAGPHRGVADGRDLGHTSWRRSASGSVAAAICLRAMMLTAPSGLMEELRRVIDPYVAAGHAHIDDVIDPRDTRPVVTRAIELARGKRVERPWKKHGVMPV